MGGAAVLQFVPDFGGLVVVDGDLAEVGPCFVADVLCRCGGVDVGVVDDEAVVLVAPPFEGVHVELLLWGVEGGGLGCHVWRSFRLVSSGAACVVEDVSSVRRAFSLTYVLTYGKTYGGTYVLAYALTGGAYIYLVTQSIVRLPTPPLVRVLSPDSKDRGNTWP